MSSQVILKWLLFWELVWVPLTKKLVLSCIKDFACQKIIVYLIKVCKEGWFQRTSKRYKIPLASKCTQVSGVLWQSLSLMVFQTPLKSDSNTKSNWVCPRTVYINHQKPVANDYYVKSFFTCCFGYELSFSFWI